MSSLRLFQKKILTPEQAKKKCQLVKKSKKRVVFTNGCFDILHPGHVSYLQEARKKGHFLIVALDTDEAVRQLKGPSRPINPLESRLQVVAALECVDAVTWFGGANPIPLIELVRPSVLVKGGDWKVSDILGSKEVLGSGGKVFSLPYIEGKSTTEIIKKIVAVSQ